MNRAQSFQQIILTLQQFWADQGCVIMQPYDQEMGAGTFHPATTLKCLGPKPWKAAYVQSCRRPTDSRYGENPNRLQQYYQFQVILKPSPDNIQDLCLQSLELIGIDRLKNDLRFVEDNWESPTLGAWGLGWELWLNGMEAAQFTYMQQVGGIACNPISGEITYGLERIAMNIQNVDNILDIDWNGAEAPYNISYADVHLQAEKEFSAYNLEYANTDLLLSWFSDAEKECNFLLTKDLVLPAYDFALKASHLFNLLDARGVISVTERASYIARVRVMSKACCLKWVEANNG